MVSGSCPGKEVNFKSPVVPAPRGVEGKRRRGADADAAAAPLPGGTGETKGKAAGGENTLHLSRAMQVQCFCKTFLPTAALYILFGQRILGVSSAAPIAPHTGAMGKG